MQTNDWCKLDKTDFWMGMAFMFASKSKSGHAAILADNINLFSVAIESPSSFSDSGKFPVPAEISAIINCTKKIEYSHLYTTKTISHEAALVALAVPGIKRIVFYPTEPLSEEVVKISTGSYVEIVPYEGNLYWLQDYIKSIDLFNRHP